MLAPSDLLRKFLAISSGSDPDWYPDGDWRVFGFISVVEPWCNDLEPAQQQQVADEVYDLLSRSSDPEVSSFLRECCEEPILPVNSIVYQTLHHVTYLPTWRDTSMVEKLIRDLPEKSLDIGEEELYCAAGRLSKTEELKAAIMNRHEMLIDMQRLTEDDAFTYLEIVLRVCEATLARHFQGPK